MGGISIPYPKIKLSHFQYPKEVILYLNHIYRKILKPIPYLTEKVLISHPFAHPHQLCLGPLIGKSRRKNIRNRYTFFRRIITFFFVRLVALDFLWENKPRLIFVSHEVKRSNQYALAQCESSRII